MIRNDNERKAQKTKRKMHEIPNEPTLFTTNRMSFKIKVNEKRAHCVCTANTL